MVMDTDRQNDGLLRFHHDVFDPAATVIKASQRMQWRSFEALRTEADERIEREVAAALVQAQLDARRSSIEQAAQDLRSMLTAFDAAALRMEQQALDLAQAIARRIVVEAAPGAFFARATEHLKALVPQGDALRVRVHPLAVGDFAQAADALRAAGARHVDVIADERLQDLRSLIVETRDGEIDLSCETQLRRMADALAQLPSEPA
jgi:flagellar biosynthesis/type III secretory pathway protein FliH